MNENITKLQNHKFAKIVGSRSASSLLKSLQVPFDRQGKSAKKALETNRTQAEVLAEWDEKGKKSRAVGLELHEYIIDVLNNKPKPQGIEALSSRSPHMNQFDLFWEKAKDIYKVVCTEKDVTSSYYRAGGRVDALLYHEEVGTFHVVDWKSGSFSSYGWNQLKPPFQDRMDSSLNLGGIQAAIYRLVIERETGVKLGDSFLVHISEDAHRADTLKDVCHDVATWLRKK